MTGDELRAMVTEGVDALTWTEAARKGELLGNAVYDSIPELAAALDDRDRLDYIDSLKCVVIIHTDLNGADSKPKVRQQIDAARGKP